MSRNTLGYFGICSCRVGVPSPAMASRGHNGGMLGRHGQRLVTLLRSIDHHLLVLRLLPAVV